MQPVSDRIRKGLLNVLADVLIYGRAWAASPTGITPERSAELNQLFNITHNVPGFIDGSYVLGFDESWFIGALQRFDQRNGTKFADAYAAGCDSSDAAGVAHFRAIAGFVDLLVATGVQLLEHHYHDDSFGSWCMLVRRHRADFRIVFDGRDSTYQLDRVVSGSPGRFETIWQNVGPRETVPRELVDALQRAG